MRRLQNFEKKVAALTEETLCLSFETTFGTITLITWSKTRKNYLAIFGPFLHL